MSQLIIGPRQGDWNPLPRASEVVDLRIASETTQEVGCNDELGLLIRLGDCEPCVHGEGSPSEVWSSSWSSVAPSRPMTS
mmetsp:Transcript_17051/g.44212  ORF Transcript_17051/g.44212 Transcript_17051/m.44212 type:complete len:80 (+) Transcript_17051:494-733(+)